ncbi:MAG: zf-HC2 domain-containing protein [Myxococcales bacterium]|nr:zf-HC2 domain-containing protein [Myxococcales bacterium]
MTEPKVVAGLSCIQVLEKLSDYLEPDALDAADRQQIEQHLQGCSWCEQFGDGFVRLLEGFRSQQHEAPKVPDSVMERLQQRLDEES